MYRWSGLRGPPGRYEKNDNRNQGESFYGEDPGSPNRVYETKRIQNSIKDMELWHNKALHLTAIPLRSIAAGELGRSAIDL
jgi:hypothetical protein